MNWIKAAWFGEVNPWFITTVYTPRYKVVTDPPSDQGVTAPAKNQTSVEYWTREYRYEESAPMLFFFMAVFAVLMWVPYSLLVMIRFFTYTAWLSKKHPFVQQLDYNLRVVTAKQTTYDGWGY